MTLNSETDHFVDEESRYRLLVDAITDYAIYMLDRNGYVSSWNPGAQRFKGYEAKEILGKHFSSFYTEPDRATKLPARALEIAQREGKFEGEGLRLRKNGTTFWAHVVIDPIWAPSGELLGYAKITRDLTERKEHELALKKSEENFRLLVEGVTDYAIYLLDAQGKVTNWNAGAQRIKGYLPDEIIGQHFSRFYTPEDVEAGMPAKSLHIATTEGRFEKEGWRVRKNGERFWANVVIDAIHNDSGELIGFAKVTRDITEKKLAQEAIEQAREAFFHSQKLEAIGQLTGGVAHDFNNLLMAVLSSLELMRKRLPDDTKTLQLLDNAVQAAQRGKTLTQRMLAFARRQDLNVEITNVISLVKNMSELLERTLGPATHVSTTFPLSLPAVNIDANQLELAILNLAVNARDASPEGGNITISAVKKTLQKNAGTLMPGDYICLSVKDEGSGMDEATLTRATEPFFTTKGVGKGTGLGLSMVHGFAEQSGGSLQILSRLGEGTTVELWIPVSQEKISDEVKAEKAEEQSAPAPAKKLNILAVDDDALVLMNTVMMLEEIGHDVVEAASAQEALDILRSGSPVDVVISDHAMPTMSGADLACIIQTEWPGKPVILATGYAELPSKAAELLPRLSKPFTEKELAEIIAKSAP